jgi:glycosyltransferase involved in cell wall biosynthesis
MKILLVVPNFVPELGSAAHLYHDLAKSFVSRGHEVNVITSYPRKFYLNETDSDKQFPSEEIIEGIRIHRCKHNAIRDNIILRGMEHFLLPFYYFRTYQRLNRKFDVCLIYIPPLPLYYFARALKMFDGTPSVLNYQDFHPQELVDVGLLKNNFLIKLMEYIERQSYKNADFITVLSGGRN